MSLVNAKAKRLVPIVSLVPLMAALLAGCGTSPTRTDDDKGDFLLALPRITIEIDKEGFPSIAGIGPKSLEPVMAAQGMDVNTMKVPPEGLQFFTDANIQHLEILHQDNGLFIFSNGQLLPHLGWDATTWGNVGDTVEMVGKGGMLEANTANLVKQLLPLLRHVGIDLLVKFPLKDGAAVVMPRDVNTEVAYAAPADATVGFVGRVRIKFDQEGVPSLAGLSSRLLTSALAQFGVPMPDLVLPKETVQQMMDAGIQDVRITAQRGGLGVSINGKALPTLAWNEDNLKTTSALVTTVVGPMFPMGGDRIGQVVDQVVPQLQNLNLEVGLSFPSK